MTRRSAAPTAKAIAFFTAHSPVRGADRRRLAKQLAKAEAEASARGWRIEWFADPDPTDDGEDAMGAVLRDEHGHMLNQRWGVVGSRPRRRVVEAQLALETLERRG